MLEGRGTYYGCTMITFDLDSLARHWRGPLDEAARERLRSTLEGSMRVRLRATRLALAEVARKLPDRELGMAQIECSFRLVEGWLHLDVDFEQPYDVCSRRMEG